MRHALTTLEDAEFGELYDTDLENLILSGVCFDGFWDELALFHDSDLYKYDNSNWGFRATFEPGHYNNAHLRGGVNDKN
jgi:hypothetical protein